MIKLVIGTAGSGKTHYARQLAAELALSGQRAAILIPEQFSFETERAMLELLEPRYADRVEVFSFTKLAAKVAREVGGTAGRRLDECGRAAVMNVAMNAVRDHLTLYAGMKRGQTLIANMLAAIGEFKSCAVSPEMLAEAAEQIDESVLAQKLRELSLIYGAYNACIANIGSIDPLDDLSHLADHLGQLDYFEGMTVIADSFTGFTQQEWKVVQKIVAQCRCFTATLCCDTVELQAAGECPTLFHTVQATAGQFFRLDSEVQWEVLTQHPRFQNEALRAVEAGVFRGAPTSGDTPSDGHVTVYAADDPYDETEFTAREIRRLIREERMRRRDFAIICRTASDYQVPMLRALSLQGISCFCDKRTPVTELPVIRFVLAALDIVTGRWRSEDILRWLKTGMVRDISMIDAARLENYCFLWNISGSAWKREFTQSPNGYSDRETESGGEALQAINEARACVCRLLEELEDGVKRDNASGRDMAAAVYRLIESAGAGECVERMLPKLSPSDADVQGQAWNALMNILDQLADILGDAPVSFAEFSELFTLMVGLCDIGRIPQGLDQVVFGTADRIRTSNPKAVFLLGANDGVFPLTPEQGGVFTDNERRLLLEMQLPLSGDMEETAASEQFLAYSAMTCASEKLYVTYSKAVKGEALYSSEIVSELKRVLPDCVQLTSDVQPSLRQIEHIEAGFLLAAGCAGNTDEFSRALVECYRRREEYADKMEVVRRAAAADRPRMLHDKQAAYALFGSNIHLSASKAECYYQCKFMYFCKYGMKTLPRRRAELDPLEYGSVVHYVLEKLLRQYDIGALVSDPDLKGKIAPFLQDYLNEVMGGEEMKSARFLYLFKRLVDTLAVLAVQLGEEFAKSLFAPYSFELPIGEGSVKPLRITLSDGTHMTVSGKIDRVDIFRHDGVSYVRVVDYKTGSKEFVLSDILSGLNMQMLIYLDILCDSHLCEEEFSPAGVVYSPASLGKISGLRGETQFDEERRDRLKKNGLIVDDSDIINAMEIGMEKKTDKKANASVKGAATFRPAATYVADTEQFGRIRQYVRSLLREMGEALHSGEIEASPAKGRYDACAFCDYRVMCSQEQKEHGRDIQKKSMTETMALLDSASEVTAP